MSSEGSSSVEDTIRILQKKQDSTAFVLENLSKMLNEVASRLDTMNTTRGSLLGRGPTMDVKKTLKTDMPKFDGNNMEGWLYKVKKFIHFHNVPEGERILVATMNMEGEALKWLLWMDSEGQLNSWSEFMEDI